MPAIANGIDPVKIGEWLADPRDDSLMRGSEKVKVEPRTMRLLMRLASTPGAVVSQDELLESVWTGVVVGTASIYQSMSQLRKVLGDNEDPPRYIETVARKGYRLVATVSAPLAPAVASPAGAEPAAPVDAPLPVPAARRSGRKWMTIAAVALLAVGLAVWRFAPRTDFLPPSIAVLPFVDMTNGQDEQVFCDGLTEETSNWLAQVPTLRVVARTSAFSYRNRNADVRLIGRELSTSHILEGSLRRSGDHLRVTVQLIDTSTGYHLWSNSYDVEAGDDISVQERIARSVVGNLELRMTAETESRFASRRSRSSQAERLFVLARMHASKGDSQSSEQAIALYRQALQVDPDFALAKVWLARAISARHYLNDLPMESLAPEIEPLLADVAKSAPQLVDLYVVRGTFELQMHRRDAALADLRHALQMNPNSDVAADSLGYYFLTAVQPREAANYFQIASRLDPRNHFEHAYLCMALTDMAQFENAESACDSARALAPESPWVYSVSSRLEAARGHLDSAIHWNELALRRGADIAAINAERGGWMVDLGLLPEAGKVFEQSLAVNADGTRRNASMVDAGAMAAIAANGSQGLRSFIQDNDLDRPADPRMMLELAHAKLLVGEVRAARDYVDRALASPALKPEEFTDPYSARIGYSNLLIVAAALRATGDSAGADKRLDELGQLIARLSHDGVQTHGLALLEAQLAAMRGKPDEAMAALKRAQSLGWCQAWLAERVVYFESLRSRADFRELLAAVHARNALTAAKLTAKFSLGSFRRPGVRPAAWEM